MAGTLIREKVGDWNEAPGHPGRRWDGRLGDWFLSVFLADGMWHWDVGCAVPDRQKHLSHHARGAVKSEARARVSAEAVARIFTQETGE